MRKRTRLSIFLACLSISLLLQGCSALQAYEPDVTVSSSDAAETTVGKISDAGEKAGGTLRLYLSKINTANPLFASDVYLSDLYSLVFESLFYLDEECNPLPLLAKSQTISEDGLEWTIQLRDDVYWHDGSLLTANDVSFTLDLIRSCKEGCSYKSKLSVIEKCTVIDEHSIKLVLKQPYAFLAEYLTFPVIPMDLYSGVDTEQLANTEFLPIGSGPYKCIKLDTDKEILLEKNIDWWQTKSPEIKKNVPNIDYISASIYSKQPLEAFSNGLIDTAYIDKLHTSEYKEFSETLLYLYPGRNLELISFNTEDKRENRILKSKPVRKAIASMLDREKLVKDIAYGKAIAWESPILKSTWLFEEGDGLFYQGKMDFEEILTEDGWKLDKGIWTKRILNVSTKLDLDLLVNNDSKFRLDMADEIKAQLEANGIIVNIVPLLWDQMLARIHEGKYEMALIGCTIPESSIARSLYTQDIGKIVSDTLSNISRINNFALKNEFAVLNGLKGKDELKAKASEILSMIYEDAAYTGICINEEAAVYSRRIRNLTKPHAWNRFNNIEKWYLVDNEMGD